MLYIWYNEKISDKVEQYAKRERNANTPARWEEEW